MSEISDEELKEQLKKYFNHTGFKSDLQKKAIKSVLAGKKNVYVSMPTGSGKSLCYQLPGVMQENKVTIVISPLIALIKNQIDYLLSKKICATTINSTIGTKERDKIFGDLKAKKTETKFLYITPEQAATHTFQELFKLLFKFQKIGFVAVDEAHCVSSWGHDFRKDYLKLGDWRRQYPSISWMALTATAPLIVRQDIIANLSFNEPIIFQVPCFRKNLFYDIVYKNSLQDDFIELKNFIQQHLGSPADLSKMSKEKPCAIIYCRKKETTESVAVGLRKQGLSCQAFHSGLKKSEKENVQDDWMCGKVAVIVATVAFGMGIDHQHVRLVVHWDLSQNIAAYYQESGRAGRDGKKSYCRLYYDRDEVRSITFLLNQDLGKVKDVKSEKYERAKNALKEFNKIVDHCENTVCRHLLFTKYFGDPPPKCDSMCDVCKDKKGCQKRLDTFLQLSARVSLGTAFRTAAEEADCSDLYEGGRNSSKGTFGNYDNEDDDAGGGGGVYGTFKKASEKERKDERSFIEKQFALRKMKAAAAMEMNETASISRVKNARATETKVIGLTVSTRESNLSVLVLTLKANMEKAALRDPPDMPITALVHRDLEDIGVEIEHKCFESVKAVSLYRRNIAKETHAIKTCHNLHPYIRNHAPKKYKPHGGDYKTIVSDLKDRYGEDVINELEDEMKGDSSAAKARKEAAQQKSASDGKCQTKINSFFEKKPKIEPAVVVDEENSDMKRLETMKRFLEDELKEVGPTSEGETSREEEDVKPEKVIVKVEKEENDEGKKRKANDEIVERPSKVSRMENPFKTASQLISSNNGQHVKNSSSSSRDHQERSTAKRSRNKSKISEIVISNLNQFYRDRKIRGENPKALFKTIARKATHYFYEKNPDLVDRKEINARIVKAFSECGSITSEEEFRLE